jgi:hypothetical protein
MVFPMAIADTWGECQVPLAGHGYRGIRLTSTSHLGRRPSGGSRLDILSCDSGQWQQLQVDLPLLVLIDLVIHPFLAVFNWPLRLGIGDSRPPVKL